ncbi:MAG TPA: MFS transporter [Opitutaceae bacterium]
MSPRTAKLLQFASLGLVLQAGLVLGLNGADSVFLVRAGADKLPRIYLALPAIMLGYIPVYSALMSRWGVDRTVDATLGALAAGGTILWLALAHATGVDLPMCYAAKLWAALWYVGLYTLYWSLVDGYFDLFDAKRLFALLAAGSASGAIIGGLLVGPITARFGVPALFLGWAVLSVAAWPLAVMIRRRWTRLAGETETASDGGTLREAAEGTVAIFRSRYALVLTGVLFLTLIAAATCEFQYLGIFSAGRAEGAVATLLGHLTALANGFNLLVSLFLFSPLVARLGVRNVAFLQCAAYAAVFSWLLLDGGFPAAVAGFFAYQGLMTSVDFNNINLLFAGLPAERRPLIRTVIEGFGEPLAIAGAGLFLLLAAPHLAPEQISLVGVAVALAGMALVFALRVSYVAAIGANLRRDWLDLSRSCEPILRSATGADLDLAEARSAVAAPAEAGLALRLLRLNDPARGVRALLAFVRRAPAGSQLPVKLLLDEALARPDSADARAVQRWLDEYDTDPDAAFPDTELAGELGRHRLLSARRTSALLRLGGPEARGAAAVALWQSWRVPDNRSALLHIEELLGSDDEAAVLAGLHTLGWIGEERYAYLLRDYVGSPSPEVRRAALDALRTLAGPSSRVLLPEALAAVRTGRGPDRVFALEAVERIGDPASFPALLASAGTFTPAERRRTEQLILRLGQGGVPVLTEIVQNARLTGAGRSVALRALGKLALPQVQSLAVPLVESIARRCYFFLASRAALGAGAETGAEAGRAVLARIGREYPSLGLDLILETLAVAGRLPHHEAIAAGLRGGQSKDRGYAIEAVEQACRRSTFALLLPLLDGRPLDAQAAFARDRGMVRPQTESQVLIDILEHEFSLAAAAAAQALLASGGADERVLARLQAAPYPLLAETLLAVLARRDGTSRASPVDIARAFLASPDFAAFRYPQHAFLAPSIEAAAAGPGTVLCAPGQDLPGVWLVAAGTLQSGGRTLHPGQVGGAELLRGSRRALEGLAAGPEFAGWHVPAAALRRAAEVFPDLALALLERKLAA